MYNYIVLFLKKKKKNYTCECCHTEMVVGGPPDLHLTCLYFISDIYSLIHYWPKQRPASTSVWPADTGRAFYPSHHLVLFPILRLVFHERCQERVRYALLSPQSTPVSTQSSSFVAVLSASFNPLPSRRTATVPWATVIFPQTTLIFSARGKASTPNGSTPLLPSSVRRWTQIRLWNARRLYSQPWR